MGKVIDATEIFFKKKISHTVESFDYEKRAVEEAYNCGEFDRMAAEWAVIEQYFIGSFDNYCFDYHGDELNELVSFYPIENPSTEDLAHMGKIYNKFLKFARNGFRKNLSVEIERKMNEMQLEQQQLDRMLQIVEIEQSQKAQVIQLSAQKEEKERKEKGK